MWIAVHCDLHLAYPRGTFPVVDSFWPKETLGCKKDRYSSKEASRPRSEVRVERASI